MISKQTNKNKEHDDVSETKFQTIYFAKKRIRTTYDANMT